MFKLDYKGMYIFLFYQIYFEKFLNRKYKAGWSALVPSERTLGREGVYLPLPFGQRPFDVLIDRTKVGISFYISKFILLKFEKKIF